jgi:hypothetical protein
MVAMPAMMARSKSRGRAIVSAEPSIQTNVDVFSENGGYFVRTEIEARIVQVHGPVADAETAKRQQASQAAHLKASTEALRRELQKASSPG